MSNKENQKLQAEEEQNSKLFRHDVNYEQPSNDRPYVYWVGKTKLFVNLEQFKFLRQDYWEEKHTNWLKSRCFIPAERGLWKICLNKCEECPSFRNGRIKPTYSSLEDMDEEQYLKEHPQQTMLDKIIEEETNQAIHDAIESIEDPIDRYIIYQFMDNQSDVQIGDSIGKSRQYIRRRRIKTFEILKKILKNF